MCFDFYDIDSIKLYFLDLIEKTHILRIKYKYKYKYKYKFFNILVVVNCPQNICKCMHLHIFKGYSIIKDILR